MSDRAPGGFSKTRLARLTRAMERHVAQGSVAGVLTFVERHGEEAHCDVIGWQDEEARVPLALGTLFRIASMTKPIVSVAALMLVEEGLLRLSDPVDKWLPELANPRVLVDPAGPLSDTYPAPRAITLRDLLLHRSGIAYPLTATGPFAAALSEFNELVLPKTMPMDEWMMRLGQLPLAYAPGARWHYGFSTDVLGVLLGRVCGTSFPDVLRTRIFAPLGMNDSAFWVTKDKIARLGPAYTPDPKTGKRVVVDRPSTSRWADPASFPSGGAGLLSTVDDYLKFARVILGRGEANGVRLLSRKMFDLMTTDHLTAEERATPFLGMEFWGDQTFGLGISIGTDPTKHEGLTSRGRLGWPGAYGTWWVADPQEDMIALMMIQLYFGNGSTVRGDCETMIYQAIAD